MTTRTRTDDAPVLPGVAALTIDILMQESGREPRSQRSLTEVLRLVTVLPWQARIEMACTQTSIINALITRVAQAEGRTEAEVVAQVRERWLSERVTTD